jgi:predicted phage tail protein
MQIAGYLMYPKPKRPKPEAAREMDKQTAESGKPIPVIFGSMTISSANLLDAADKEIITRETTVSKK